MAPSEQRLPWSQLQPTQLYISKLKLARARRYLEERDYRDYAPLPVKQIGRVLFFTDGHIRALLLWRAGHTEIKTVLDQDDMEWASSLENVELGFVELMFYIAQTQDIETETTS